MSHCKLGLGLLCAVTLTAGCGDDATSTDTGDGGSSGTSMATTAAPTTAGDTVTPGTSGSGSATDTGEGSTGPGATSAIGTSTGEATDTGMASTGGSSSSSGGEEDSSSGGQVIGNCGVCAAGEICVAFESFMTTYECRPLPAECMGDVDCECGSSLCEDPFVACFDPPEPDQLSCICIAC